MAAIVVLLQLLPIGAAAVDAAAPLATDPQGGAAIPFKSGQSVSSGLLLRVALASIFSVGLVVAVVALLKRRLHGRGALAGATDRRMSVLEVKRVSPKLTLVLVAVDDRHYLLAQSGDQVQVTEHSPGAERSQGGSELR